MALCRTVRVTPMIFAAFGLAACVAQPPSSPGGEETVSASPQPRSARYSCADGSTLTIENRGSSIRVRDEEGAVGEDLPASPPNQTSRFGAEQHAVLIDGREVLVMKAGHRPLACRR